MDPNHALESDPERRDVAGPVKATFPSPATRFKLDVRQAEAGKGRRPDLPTSEEREEIRELRREVFELRRMRS